MAYLISAYFDSDANHILERYIRDISIKSGNGFMIENHVPPHMTISSFEARSDEVAKAVFERIQSKLRTGEIFIPAIGVFFPSVIYAEAVQNLYLYELSKLVYEELLKYEGIIVSRYYQPLSWIPHVTLGKTLDEEQLREAFTYLQKNYSPIKARIQGFGLAKTNPHRDILKTKMEENLG